MVTTGGFRALAGLMLTLALTAQPPSPPEDPLTILRKAGALESPGAVNLLFAPQARERALALQKSLEAARSWYEKQLHIQVPTTLAVLDEELYGKLEGPPYPTQYSAIDQGIIVVPARIEGQRDPQAALQGEQVTFHEAGHLFAYQLKIRSGNDFINELVAQIFTVGYIRAERPDLGYLIDNPLSAQYPTPPRYTSLGDLYYLGNAVGARNNAWYRAAFLRLADYLLKDQSFPQVIEKLRAAFPRDEKRRETMEEIEAHLEAIRPGFIKTAGPLAMPTTIPPVKPSGCTEKSGSASSVVVRNETNGPLVVTNPEGETTNIPVHASERFFVEVGESLKLSTGACLVASREPAVAVIEK